MKVFLQLIFWGGLALFLYHSFSWWGILGEIMFLSFANLMMINGKEKKK
jgi:hypothetical protein